MDQRFGIKGVTSDIKKIEPKNPWSDKGDAAIVLVKKLKVSVPPYETFEPKKDKTTQKKRKRK
ncbi:MAG: hypothetical protein AAF485_18605, partial [Chloroflexota bacterium]